MLPAEELLTRMSGLLRHEIGPAVSDPFPKTQAFMASVVLDKVAAGLRHGAAHAEANEADRVALAADLRAATTASDPAPLLAAIDALPTPQGDAALAPLVAALYATRSELGADRFDALLARVRQTLRARLDRQLEVAS